jgi:glycosyltransferase involved in cell wall biosynthesis
MNLSIIIPVYGVEKYIRPCFESIFRQALKEDSYEIIIVNDGTKDRSMEMIADIIKNHSNITIINQENQGLSVARNNGIAMAKGEYILMPDSDDMLIDNSVPYLLEKALDSKADVVVADFIEMQSDDVDKNDLNAIKQKDGKIIEKTGEELFLKDLSPYQSYVWRSLFRRQFILDNKLSFFPGILYQDIAFIHECYIKAKKCLRINWLLNIYRRREESATFTFTMKKSRDFCIAIGKTWELSHMDGLSPQMMKKLQDDVFTNMSVMLWCTSHVAMNASERKGVISFLKEQAPDLYLTNGAKQIITTFMFRWMPHTFARFRYLYDIYIVDMLIPFYHHKIKPLTKLKR